MKIVGSARRAGPDRSPKSWILSLQMEIVLRDPACTPTNPTPRAVEETRNDAVLADLEDRAEAAGDECGGGAGTFGHGGSRCGIGAGQGMGVMPEDRTESEQGSPGVG